MNINFQYKWKRDYRKIEKNNRNYFSICFKDE